MNVTRRTLLTLAAAGGLSACARERVSLQEEPVQEVEPEPTPEPEEPSVDLAEFEALALDMDDWSYDATNDCYYQLGIPYCTKPGSEQYESLAIFVPGAYFTATKKGSTYRCAVAEEARVGSYTPATAPVALPINSVHFSGQACPTSYSYEGLGRYLGAGMVYVYAGLRGRSGGYESTTQAYFPGGVPWAVTDLKAVVRWLRYNAEVLPGSMERIFAFGCGGGGGYGALLAATGNAEPYAPYLAEIGAATHDAQGADLGDEIAGSASWCPVVSFDSEDAAYEWMMGQYASSDSRAEGPWTALLSKDLAGAYAEHVNTLGLTDEEGAPLTLDRIDDGSYTGGTYYERVLSLVRDSATDFFQRTKFPYTSMPADQSDPHFPGDPDLRSSLVDESDREGNEEPSATAGVRQVQATVYETLESYVAALNGDNRWLTYNASRGEANVTGLWGFVRQCRPATRSVCAYDALDRSGTANQLFGTDEEPSVHFDAMVADLLEANRERYAAAEGWDEGLAAMWRADLAQVDLMETSVAERVTLSCPIPFIRGEVEGVAPAIAPHWRINSGLFQADSTLVSEMNLVCALQACDAVADVAFEEVWEAGFGLAERSGDPEDNLVAWICSCCPEEPEDPEEENE